MLFRLMLVVLLGLPCSHALAQPGEPGYGANPTEDRELIVRFARTYGMMQAAMRTAAVPEDQAEDLDSLQEPVRSQAFTILDTNGIELETWQAFLERLDNDDQLRQRIESLAAPFQVQ